MSILSVDTIQPIGSGSTVTLNAAKIVVGTGITFESNGQAIYAGIITATSFSGTASNASGATGDFSIADSIVHSGDTNTKIRFPAADTVTVETAGSERLRINSDGDVLINTVTTPSADIKLLVAGNGGVSSGSYFSFRGDYGNVPEPAAYAIKFDSSITKLHQYAYGGIAFNLGGQKRVNFAQDGSVGIGTDNPQRLLHLQSTGDALARITSADGNAAYLELGDVSDPDGGKIVYDSANNLELYTASSPRLRIASNGHVGINRTSPTRKLHVAADNDLTSFTGTSYGIIAIENNQYDSGEYNAIDFTYSGSNNAVARIAAKITGGGSSLHFGTSNNYSSGITNEALTITSDGRIRANTQSAYSNEKFLFYFSGTHDNQDCFTIQNHNSYENTALIIKHGRGGLSGYSGKSISFRGNDNSEEGSIVIGTSSVAFNTSSDYRLKENQVAISDGITRLKTLKPYRFNFKKDTGTTVDGFFAHEVTAVPEAVSGEKDAMKKIYYEEGDTLPSGKNLGDFKEFSSTEISPQSMDHSKLVPLLTAALQEEIAKREALEARIAALEGS